MKIFDKRPLSLILCIMLGGFVFSSYSIPAYKIAIPIIATTLLCISFFLFNTEKSKILLLRICTVVLLIASLFSYLYFDVYFAIYNRYEEASEIIATVEDVNTNATPISVTLNLETVNSIDEEGFKVIASTDFDTITNVSVGAKVKVIGVLEDFEESATYYKAQGISARLTSISELDVLSVNDFDDTLNLQKYRDELAKEIIISTDGNSGGFLSALLLGERSYLNAQTKLDFQRTGTSHILALSGMHLAILTLTIGKILSLLRFNKKSRKLIEILFVSGYMALTGFSSSVVRAGVMLIISSLLFLLSRKSDSITTLFIAVTVICIFDPCSVFDISLWLSMLATFGILVLSEMNAQKQSTDTKESFLRRSGKGILFAFLASVFAISTTMLLTTLSFGTISPIGLIVTPIISPFISLFMNLGLLLIILPSFIQLGPVVEALGDFICDAIGYASSFKGFYTSADFLTVKILIFIFSVLVVCFFIFNVKRKKTAILIICLLLFASYSTAIINTAIAKNEIALDYSVTNGKESIYVSSDSHNAIIDLSSPTSYSVNSRISNLSRRHLTEVDSYVFANYSTSLVNATETLLSSIYVETIYIPQPVGNAETELHRGLTDLSERYRTSIVFYDTDDMIFFGDITYFPVYRSTDDTDKLAFTIKYNDNFYSYTSAEMFDTNTEAVAFSIIDGCHTLILGTHGSDYERFKFQYNLYNVDTLIISSKCFTLSDNVIKTNETLKVKSDPSHVSLIR